MGLFNTCWWPVVLYRAREQEQEAQFGNKLVWKSYPSGLFSQTHGLLDTFWVGCWSWVPSGFRSQPISYCIDKVLKLYQELLLSSTGWIELEFTSFVSRKCLIDFVWRKASDSVAIAPDGTICISYGAEEKIPSTLADEHFVSVKSSGSLVVSNFWKTCPRWIFVRSLCILEMIGVGDWR